ncbi:DUF6082 family protein [Streptomyces sp. NPDC053474]|uniref:DUF6082 family protein n=1 Tax=Streptomyces sp. NPDC053474 TaxID=3365704 RepID=UPI0037D71CA0
MAPRINTHQGRSSRSRRVHLAGDEHVRHLNTTPGYVRVDVPLGERFRAAPTGNTLGTAQACQKPDSCRASVRLLSASRPIRAARHPGRRQAPPIARRSALPPRARRPADGRPVRGLTWAYINAGYGGGRPGRRGRARVHRGLPCSTTPDPEPPPVSGGAQGSGPERATAPQQPRFAYRVGNITRSELLGHVRGTLQNPIVREHWEATRTARASLEETSVEAQIGRMVDRLIRELDEAETDEWWVVGDPPE